MKNSNQLSLNDSQYFQSILEKISTSIEYDYVVSTMLAALLGIIIGMERKSKGRSVGPKTGSLICLSSCVFTLVSSMFPGINADPTRVMAQIVSGIGFLGTAVIISKEGSKIGITSAATVWMTAAIGMVLGVKHYFLAVYLTSLYLFVTIIVGTIEHKISERSEKSKNK